MRYRLAPTMFVIQFTMRYGTECFTPTQFLPSSKLHGVIAAQY